MIPPTYEALVAESGVRPDLPIDATHALRPVRPTTGRYPDPGPDLTAARHTTWPGDPPREHVSTAEVWEQGAAILRRLALIEAKLDELLTSKGAP